MQPEFAEFSLVPPISNIPGGALSTKSVFDAKDLPTRGIEPGSPDSKTDVLLTELHSHSIT